MNGKSHNPTVRRPQSQGRSHRAVNRLYLEELEPRLLLSADLAGGLGVDGGWQAENPPVFLAEVELLAPAVDASHHGTDRGTEGLEPHSRLPSTEVLPPPVTGVAAEDLVRNLRLGPVVFHPADPADAPLPGEHAPADALARGPGMGPDDAPGHQWGSGGSPTPPGTQPPEAGQPEAGEPGAGEPGKEPPGPWANRPADPPEPGEGDPKAGPTPGPQPPPVAGPGGPNDLVFEEAAGEGLRPSSDWGNDSSPKQAQAAEPPDSRRHPAGALSGTGLVQDHPITWPEGLDLQEPSEDDDTIWHPWSSEASAPVPEPTDEEEMTQEHVSTAVFGTVGVGALGLSSGALRWAVRVWTLLGSLLSSIPLWKRAKGFPVLRRDVGRGASPGKDGQAPAKGVRPETGEEIDRLFDSKEAP